MPAHYNCKKIFSALSAANWRARTNCSRIIKFQSESAK